MYQSHKAEDTVTEQDTARQENVSHLYKIEDVELWLEATLILYPLLSKENNHDDSWRVIVFVEKNIIRSSFPQQD